MTPRDEPLHVGIVGGGLGGLATAIAVARGGAGGRVRVTVLEAAAELGEVGAGIQMSGNVSRFLVRTGVDKLIGDNLVAMDECRNWVACHGDDGAGGWIDDVPGGRPPTEQEKFQGRLIGRFPTRDVARVQGFPWWVVRRDHLHAGLAEGARRVGVELVVDARVRDLQVDSTATGDGKVSTCPGKVTVTTQKGASYRFDLVIGADGINSTVRQRILPDLVPVAASTMAAYRAVVPYADVFEAVPEARSILGNTMDAYAGPGGYVLLYPLSGGRELNVVTAAYHDHDVRSLETLATVDEFRAVYKDFPPFVRRILGLVKETKRWPLLVVPPTDRWSNEARNVVLMGDAAHGMQNHMAQGAATAMEDGMFLGRIISEVVRGAIPLAVGMRLYEEKRMPRCWVKQQSAFCQGVMWASGGATQRARDGAMYAGEVAGGFARNPVSPGRERSAAYRSWLLFASPDSVPGILHYDAEGDADFAVCEYLQKTGRVDPRTLVVDGLRDKWASAMWGNGLGPAPAPAWERRSKL